MGRCRSLLVLVLALFTVAWPTQGASAGRWPPIAGLTSMGSLSFVRQGGSPANSLDEVNTHPEIYRAVAINATWNDLEPTTGGPLDTATIDAALQRVDTYNAQYPRTPLVAELRVFAGAKAPDWAKSLNGGPLPMDRGQTIGFWWKTDYRAAWRNLQNRLAARYRNDPRIHEVAVTSCAMMSEPLIEPFGGDYFRAFAAAGYTDAAGLACVEGASDDFSGWTRQALNFSFSPMRCIDQGRPVQCYQNVARVIREFRGRYGSAAIIGNHGLRAELIPVLQPVYQLIDAAGPPAEFQFASQPDCTDAAFNEGLHHHMTNFEVWDTQEAAGTRCDFTWVQLREMSRRLGGY